MVAPETFQRYHSSPMWIDNEERNNLVKQNQGLFYGDYSVLSGETKRFLYVPMWNKLNLLGRNWMFLHRHAPCHHNWVTNSECSLSHELDLRITNRVCSVGCPYLRQHLFALPWNNMQDKAEEKTLWSANLEAADKIHPDTQKSTILSSQGDKFQLCSLYCWHLFCSPWFFAARRRR